MVRVRVSSISDYRVLPREWLKLAHTENEAVRLQGSPQGVVKVSTH